MLKEFSASSKRVPGHHPEVRLWKFGTLARSIFGYAVKEIADHFRPSSVTVSEATRKVEKHSRKDKMFEKKLELAVENMVKERK